MMVQNGNSTITSCRCIIKAIHDEEMLPRYVVGTDAAMFLEAKK